MRAAFTPKIVYFHIPRCPFAHPLIYPPTHPTTHLPSIYLPTHPCLLSLPLITEHSFEYHPDSLSQTL
jgi:hypothetical protein